MFVLGVVATAMSMVLMIVLLWTLKPTDVSKVSVTVVLGVTIN